METLQDYQRLVLKRAFIAGIKNLSAKAYIDRTIPSYKKFDVIAIFPVAFGFETSLRKNVVKSVYRTERLSLGQPR